MVLSIGRASKPRAVGGEGHEEIPFLKKEEGQGTIHPGKVWGGRGSYSLCPVPESHFCPPTERLRIRERYVASLPLERAPYSKKTCLASGWDTHEPGPGVQFIAPLSSSLYLDRISTNLI